MEQFIRGRKRRRGSEEKYLRGRKAVLGLLLCAGLLLCLQSFLRLRRGLLRAGRAARLADLCLYAAFGGR